MPLGSKAKYTAAQKRKASRIEQSYEDKGVPKSEAEARAWATVNKQSGGGEKAGGSGQRKAPAKKAQDRHDSAKRAAASREGHPRNSRVSLSTQTKESLLKEARAKDIRGRSSMRKDQLIEALKKAG
ncbi:termination factor Rho [Pseudomonas rhodesiae]|uniref:Rho termination factor, N-terminal domain n=1 Tax=Pseudomonas rhodesiae TaxID=76760 RepID=A0AAE8H9E0_9PSED|nr:termination factor Rho [Pseudomonas rhodesiae]OXS19516.1 termination factor Rho [Pseudomonas fluorescens]OZO46399.1 termination factor Rho [Pseudomonas fluorescens]ROM60356.1 termination factor Rho [Pseudomonas rhodesiae]ROM68122.1 termination factor Rho [Pseudomonas rhodesiae]TGY13005.1 termination factor Rho [Pseudomonas fluorescens]